MSEENGLSGTDFGLKLRSEATAVRVHHSKMGLSRALGSGHRSRAAELFGADNRMMSASKKLLDAKTPEIKRINQIRSAVNRYVESVTLQYPEPGVRLLRREKLEEFTMAMEGFRGELEDAVSALAENYGAIKESARETLGELYDPADYPEDVRREFSLEYDFPSIDPPDYLRSISPRLYDQEVARIKAKFDEAVAVAEVAFAEQLHELVQHLAERLEPSTDGKKKVLQESAVMNLNEFFDRFRSLSVGSNAQLDSIVEEARKVVNGVDIKSLRNAESVRSDVRESMTGLTEKLSTMIGERSRKFSSDE